MLFCFLSGVLVAASCAGAETAFVKALRDRGLDRLAELRCRQELSRSGLPPREVAAFLIQLSLIEVDRATAARSGREDHWRRSGEHLRTPPAGRGPSDAWLLLRLQSGLNRSTRGGFEQAIGDASAAGTLLAARRRLEASRREIESLRRRGSGVFADRELDSLTGRVTLALAETGQRFALCHPAGSPDRDDALLQAATAARGLAARGPPGEIRWRAVLVLAACERLLGQAGLALPRLDALDAGETPAELAGALAAERWRLLRAAGREDEAQRWLDAQTAVDSPELSLARLEALTRRWKASAEPRQIELAAGVQRRLIAGRERHGGLWAARAERLAGDVLAVTAGGTVDAVVTTAEYLYRAGREEEAVEAYDRAAGIAYRDGATGRAFELARTSATLVRSRGDRLAASERFRRAALTNPQRPDAAATHRLAIVCVAEALRQQGGEKTKAAEAYGPLLAEHLRVWPESPAVGEVRWWRVKWDAARGGWRDAIGSLSAIGAGDPRYPEAVRLLGRAYTELANQAAGDPAARRAIAAEAAAQLQPTVTGDDNRWPTSWSPLQRDTALTLARLQGGAYARRLLSEAVDGRPAAADDWRRRAVVVLVPALVDEGMTDEAIKRLEAPSLADRDTAEALLAALRGRLPDNDDPRSPAARVMLAVVTSAAPQADQDNRWKAPYAAAALAALGRTEDAVRVYGQLVERFPRDATLRLKLAELMSRSADPADRRRALDGFATVERGVTKGGDAWWRARLGRLRMLVATDQVEQADKLLRLTRVLHPDLGGRSEAFRAIEDSLPKSRAVKPASP